MSFKKFSLIPPNPITARGVSTKLSASKDKIVYTNGKAVIVRYIPPWFTGVKRAYILDPWLEREQLGDPSRLVSLTCGEQNPLLTTAYSGHVQNTTVARISPSGYYCASADITGTG